MKNILILGANSAIAKAAARVWSSRGERLYLVGRDSQKLEVLAQDLKTRGNPNILTESLDLSDSSKHEALLANVTAKV
jgi:short-subunit dehydrogenase